MTDEQAEIAGRACGEAIGKAITDWLHKCNPEKATSYDAEYYIKTFASKLAAAMAWEQSRK